LQEFLQSKILLICLLLPPSDLKKWVFKNETY
jgi:hypothetical protein